MNENFWNGFEKAAARRMDKEIIRHLGEVLGIKKLTPKNIPHGLIDLRAQPSMPVRNKFTNVSPERFDLSHSNMEDTALNSWGSKKLRDEVHRALNWRIDAKDLFRPMSGEKTPNRVMDMLPGTPMDMLPGTPYELLENSRQLQNRPGRILRMQTEKKHDDLASRLKDLLDSLGAKRA